MTTKYQRIPLIVDALFMTDTDFNNLRDRIFEAQSYDEALQIIGEEVTLKRKQE